MLNRLFLLYSVLLVPWVALAQESGSAETAEAEKGAWLHIRGPKASQAHIGGGSSITCSITAPEEDNFFWMKINEDMWDQLPDDSAWREASFHRHVERFENGSVSTAVSGYIDNFREEHSAYVSCGSNNPDHQRYASMMLEFKNNGTNNETDDSEAEKGPWLHIRGPKSSQAHIGGGSSITCSITAPEEDNFFWMKINNYMWDQLPDDSAWREASFHRHVERFENGSVSTAVSGYIDNFREEHSAYVSCGSNNPDHQRYASMMLEFKNNGTNNETDDSEAEKGPWLHIRGPKSSQAHIGGGSSITCSITAPEEDNFFWMKINNYMWDQLPDDSAWREASFHRHVERFENGSVSTAVSGYIDNFREEHSAYVSCGSNNPDHQRYASMMLEFKNNGTNNETDDSDKGGRDDSRDWYYESDEFWEMPDSNRRCGRGQGLDASGANCVDCPAGTYNFEDSRVDTCLPCPLGYFGNQTGMDECYDCENWGENRRGKYTTLLHGSTSPEQCIRPDRLISKFAYAKVGFRIRLKGGDFCTNIRRALWGVSKVIPFDGHFYECSFSPASETSPNAFSAMSFEATLPSKMAWEFWEVLDLIRTHRDVGNAYIKLGRPMVDKIGEFVENHSELWQLNMTLRTDMLNVDDLEILEFAPYFQGQCQPGDNSKFCDGQTTAAATVQRFYIKYSVAGSLINCASNAGYTRVRNIMERSAERGLPCLTRESGRCKMELVSCRDGEVIVALTNSFIEEANKIESLDALRAMIPSFAAMDTQFSKVDAIEGCPEGGAAFKEASAAEVAGFQVECAACEAGNFINDAGMCQRCPFGSWGEDGKQCNSCGWEFATPFWGVDRKDKCIEISNDWRRTDKSSYDDYLRDVKGENRFNLTITPQMNMCGVSEAIKEVKKSCSYAYPTADLMWDDSLDFEEIKLERILCMGVSNIQEGFSEMCGADWDKSWKEIFEALEYDFWEEDNLKDAVCYIFKRVKDLDTLDTSGNCPNLDPSQYMMSMAADFSDEIDIESSAVVIPIMKRLRNLKSMDFSSFADAGRAMMETMGINDPVAFTGWETAKELRELMLSVPNGFSMAEFEFEPKFNKEDFYCDNNNAKRQCWRCPMEYCSIYSEDEGKDIRCLNDECNNCSPSYWYFTNQTTAGEAGNETSKADQQYSCATCDFPEEIDNGRLQEVSKDGVSAMYKCNDGYVLDSCSGWAQCEWKDRSNSLTFPRCVEDKCVWPEIDNAAMWRDWRDFDWSTCPFATYKCNDGWMAANNNKRVECRPYDDFKIEHSVQCIERCSFPDVIANGTRDDSESGRTEDGRYYARYECNEGFYPRDGDYAYCNTEKYYEGEEMKFKSVAWIPSCRMGDTCEFPDVIGGARKDDEWENYGKKEARYECPDNMMMSGGSGYVSCNETEPSQLGYHNFTCHERKSCHFPDTIEGGRIIEKYDTSARYECLDGYEMSGSDWAYCNKWSGEAYLPICGKDTCDLPEQIDNGNRTQKYLNAARYECYGDFQLPLSIRYTGGWVKCNGTDLLPTEPSCAEPDSCDLPEKIYNGHQAEKHHNKARYECHGEWRLPESLRNNGGWVECSADGSHSPQYPSCEYGGSTDEDSCHLPEQIDNGHQAEKHHNKARYECHGEWRLPESLRNNDGWVECTGEGSHSPEYPRCEYGGGESECSFPDVIWGGYKYMEGENEGERYAVYACNELFVMTPNKYAFVSMVKELGKSPQEAYDMLSNVATCYKGRVMLPECRHRDEAGHCGIPVYIPNGKAKELKMMDYQKEDSSTAERSEDGASEDGASEDGASEDGASEDGASEDGESEYDYEKKMLMMMPVAARYECEYGYKIHETMKGSWGWCRKDGSYEIPRCEATTEWNEVEFKLHNGKENKFADNNGRVFAGVVLAKMNYARERREAEDKWEYGCNDGFNGYAAGAICRSVGFNHGTEIPLTKKMLMELPENLEFGWTDFNCDYDDTMSSSSHCRAERYEEAMGERGMKARCFNFDRIAVKCFDNAQFNVTVSVWNNKNTITCQAMAYKEDKSIPIGWIDEIEPKFMIDDKVLNLKPKYNKKRGYFVRAKNQLKEEFSCISCEVHAGEYLIGKAEKCKEE